MNLAELLLHHHSPGNRFSYYPLSSQWKEIRDYEHNKIIPDREGYGLYLHIPFCQEICTYCGCNIKISRNEDEHSHYVEALLKEIELRTLHDFPLLSINFGGGTPNTLGQRAFDQLQNALQNLIGAQTLSGQMEADPRYFNSDQAHRAQNLRINRISFGVQDFIPEILSNVNRRQQPEQIHQSIEALLPNQAFGFDLLWGLPKQTRETIEQWYGHLKELNPDWISFYPLAKVPWLESIQQAYGDFALPPREEKYQLYQTGVQIFEELGFQNLGMGHFIKKGGKLDQSSAIYRKVSGLFTQKTPSLIGVGVSSISETSTSLSQNDKIIDRYIHTLLKKKELPLIKFHQKNLKEIEMNQFIEDVFSFNTIPDKFIQKAQLSLSSEWFDTMTGTITPLGNHFKKNIMQWGEKQILK